MSQQAARGPVPVLTLGWRLKMSLDYAGISVQAMADQLGVTRATISRWMSDKGSRPKKAYISQWALRTGVPFEWVDAGKITPETDPGGSSNRVTHAFLPDLLAPVVTLRHPSERPTAPNLQKSA